MFDLARKVADAVLYEGYVLYPYRASAKKNRSRWQWGVVCPRAYQEAGGSDAWDQQTEVLIEATDDTVVHLRLRFLQVQARTVEQAVDGEFRAVPQIEVGDDILVTWDEGVEHEIDTEVRLGDLREGTCEVPVELPGSRDVETITDEVRVVRERWPISARLLLSAEWLEGPYGVVKLQVRLENVTPWDGDPSENRDVACRRALVATHTLIDAGGRFVSLLDPPEWASGYAASCENVHTWPVLIEESGGGDVVLSSPIILYDYPTVAPESPGDLCDSLEIDEILTLRTMTLTDEEKREARATDPRARAIIDRSDDMPQDVLDRLHGAIRYLRSATGEEDEEPSYERPPWWDPGADSSVSPETDRIWVAGVSVGRGTRVRLRPGVQRADAQDMFLNDRIATVEAVLFSVDEDSYLAVTLEDDESSEMMAWHGRYLYFSPDEVVPLPEADAGERP
ncbi:MAG: hypothetical protein ACRDYA_03860 [Egibacteraceae bacterium]